MPKKIIVIFHTGSNYDYHFVIKELAEEFERTNYLLSSNKKGVKKVSKMEKK